MFLLIDHRDSFVYNLAAYLQANGDKVTIINYPDLTLDKIKTYYEQQNLQGIIFSPGPGHPDEYPHSQAVINFFTGKLPLLGICLGHQLLAKAVNGTIIKASKPMHGKLSTIIHTGEGIFSGLPSSYKVTRYHSLIVDYTSIKHIYKATAHTDSQELMGLQHLEYPNYGVQFHPEALFTEYGQALINNYLILAKEYALQEE